MEIVAFNEDDRADGQGKAKITWISKNLLKTQRVMNNTATAGNAGWEGSGMRTYLKNTIKPLIPETVRNEIKEVNKYSRVVLSGILTDNHLTVDDLWIPSRKELDSTMTYESSGHTYATAFPDDTSRVKESQTWWTRTAGGTKTFYSVSEVGVLTPYNANNNYYIAIGFCT